MTHSTPATPEVMLSVSQLKARYCRLLDTQRWDELRQLFTPQARFEGLGSAPQGADVATFIAGVSSRLSGATTVHHIHMPEIVATGPDTARGIWAMMDYVHWTNGFEPHETPGSPGFIGYGHYEEAYEFDGQAWRIAFLRLTRLRLDPLPAGHPVSRPGLLRLSANWLGLPGAS